MTVAVCCYAIGIRADRRWLYNICMSQRTDARRLLALIVLSLMSVVATSAAEWPADFVDDADLHSVHFVDRLTGWAVGDRGVIWHTPDGGESWNRQSAKVEHGFQAVHFVDAKQGWIASAHVHAYRMDGRGTILATADGGNSWQPMKLANLSYLHDLSVLDERVAVAVGASWPMFPTGAYHSRDGGRSWHPLSVDVNAHWVACDINTDGQILLVGTHQALADLTAQSPGQGVASTDLPVRLRDGIWLGNRAYVVGDDGTLLALIDGRWLDASQALPSEGKQFDFHAIAQAENRLWVAGAPGNLVWRSDDGGRSWQARSTGITTPIYDLCFTDARHGWAVGACGVILTTDDGGDSWRIQRGLQRRLGALVVGTSLQTMPWSVLAHLSAEHRVRSRALLIETPHMAEPTFAVGLSERVHEAAVVAGANGAETWSEFPVLPKVVQPNRHAIEAGWTLHQHSQGIRPTGVQRLQWKLARAIRQWRPEIIVLQSEDRAEWSRLLLETTLAAQELAADTERPELLASLEPWSATRVVQARVDSPVGSTKPASIEPSRLSLALGESLGALATRAHATVSSEISVTSPIFLATVAGPPLRKDWGSHFAQHQDACRDTNRQELVASASLESLSRKAQQQENVRSILERAVAQNNAERALQLMSDLPPRLAAHLQWMLAQRQRADGKLESCRQTLSSLIEQYGQLPIAEQAKVELLMLAVSEEAAVRSRLQPASGQLGSAVSPDGSVPARAVSQTKQDYLSPEAMLTQLGPNQRTRPEWQLALASHSSTKRIDSLLSRLKQSAPTKEWRLSAAAEVWLRDRSRSEPKPTWTCHLGARPHLDGQLDEPIWSDESAQQLGPLQQLNYPLGTKLWIARDDQFLYLAAECQRLPELEYPQPTDERPRDTLPGALDRVDFFFDVNRDYQTGWQLGFDSRGWAIDAESSHLAWDPRWFVAARQDEGTWTVEAAIPLRELVREPARLPGRLGRGCAPSRPRLGLASLAQHRRC